MLAALEDLRPPVEVPAARGAFYVLAKVAADADSMEVAARLIREHQVAAVPGAAFGLTAGCYLRIASPHPTTPPWRRRSAGSRRLRQIAASG